MPVRVVEQGVTWPEMATPLELQAWLLVIPAYCGAISVEGMTKFGACDAENTSKLSVPAPLKLSTTTLSDTRMFGFAEKLGEKCLKIWA